MAIAPEVRAQEWAERGPFWALGISKITGKAKKRCFWPVLPAYHNNHGDPDHQNRTRPGAPYALALCAPASLLALANNTYNGENKSNSTTVG